MPIDSNRQTTIIIKILNKFLIENIVIGLQGTAHQLAMTCEGQRAVKISAQGQEEAQRRTAFAAIHAISRCHGMTSTRNLQRLASLNHARNLIHSHINGLQATHGGFNILGHADVIDNAGTSG